MQLLSVKEDELSKNILKCPEEEFVIDTEDYFR